MALIDYLRPGFPQKQTDKTGIRRVYVMRGPTSVVGPLIPSVFGTFDGNYVDRVQSEVVETAGAGVTEVTVETYQTYATSSAEITDDQYPFFEIDWVQLEKSLRQHPEFSALSSATWAALDAWEAEKDSTARAAFQYYNRDNSGEVVGSIQTLTGTTSTGAKAFAILRLRGVESFLDFAPVVRKTSLYRGSSPPSGSDAGQKTSAPSYAPSGYEWLKTSDRVSKQGIRTTDWIRQEEWTGARVWVLDKDDLFL